MMNNGLSVWSLNIRKNRLYGIVKCLVASFLISKCYSACLLSQHDLQHSWVVLF